MKRPRATALATPIGLKRQRNVTVDDLALRFHPAYREPLARLPSGKQTIRGLPFRFGRRSGDARWTVLDRRVEIDLRRAGAASHVVIAHFCDSWRDKADGRPGDLPVGWVVPVGQVLARYTLETADGRSVTRDIRRRFEVNDGIIGWGQAAFAAYPHLVDEPLDWR